MDHPDSSVECLKVTHASDQQRDAEVNAPIRKSKKGHL